VANDAGLRGSLSERGLKRAAEFSWEKTAQLTLDVYREASALTRPLVNVSRREGVLSSAEEAICKTVDYAKLFQYPLTSSELRDRLFDVKVDRATFDATLESLHYAPNPDLVALRAEREKISDQAIQEVQPHLQTLASMPFIRLIAFSGSTANRNMTSTEDVDLFIVVEDGKLWAMFLSAVLWAKAKGLRKFLCMNYLISDEALPLSEHDPFTAQQVASLKPVYGKTVYDRFIELNPFVARHFPNFDSSYHRQVYPEIEASFWKRVLEGLLRFGPIQILERVSRFAVSRYLATKIGVDSDVQLDKKRLKLHLHSHKRAVLRALPCSFAPPTKDSHQQNVEVQP